MKSLFDFSSTLEFRPWFPQSFLRYAVKVAFEIRVNHPVTSAPKQFIDSFSISRSGLAEKRFSNTSVFSSAVFSCRSRQSRRLR
jgi:hypothetical protein